MPICEGVMPFRENLHIWSTMSSGEACNVMIEVGQYAARAIVRRMEGGRRCKKVRSPLRRTVEGVVPLLPGNRAVEYDSAAKLVRASTTAVTRRYVDAA